MIVSRILHAGFIFESGGTRIAFDPIFETPFSTNCHPFPAISFAPEATRPAGDRRVGAPNPPPARGLRPTGAGSQPASRAPTVHDYDAVFISHFHDDHCSLVSLDFIPRDVPIYLYCAHRELFEFIRAMGFDVRELRIDTAVEVGGFKVTPRLALDPDVDAVFEIGAEGLSVLNVVDAWIDPSVLSLRSSWDLVLWPFQTMRELDVLMPTRAEPASRSLPPEWVEQLRALRPRHVVPSSCQIRFEEWSWMNRAYFPITYAQFAREIPSSARMNPGESFELTAQSFTRIGRLSWIRPEGPQDVDYDYDETIFQSATTTAEIARHFPALTREQRALVDRFCEGLDVTLYDHEGRAEGSGSTEAIASKIFRAITEGEQITSMYLRTDDIDEDELIAKLSQDPLAFQRAQLKHLRRPTH